MDALYIAVSIYSHTARNDDPFERKGDGTMGVPSSMKWRADSPFQEED